MIFIILDRRVGKSSPFSRYSFCHLRVVIVVAVVIAIAIVAAPAVGTFEIIPIPVLKGSSHHVRIGPTAFRPVKHPG
jgi:hypothetical protein